MKVNLIILTLLLSLYGVAQGDMNKIHSYRGELILQELGIQDNHDFGARVDKAYLTYNIGELCVLAYELDFYETVAEKKSDILTSDEIIGMATSLKLSSYAPIDNSIKLLKSAASKLACENCLAKLEDYEAEMESVAFAENNNDRNIVEVVLINYTDEPIIAHWTYQNSDYSTTSSLGEIPAKSHKKIYIEKGFNQISTIFPFEKDSSGDFIEDDYDKVYFDGDIIEVKYIPNY